MNVTELIIFIDIFPSGMTLTYFFVCVKKCKKDIGCIHNEIL